MNADEALELARKAYPNDEDLRVAYMLGLNEGYELHKDKIMKEAVEGEVESFSDMNYPEVSIPLNPTMFKPGDKVRIIFVKED